jgi:hypothetical protein
MASGVSGYGVEKIPSCAKPTCIDFCLLSNNILAMDKIIKTTKVVSNAYSLTSRSEWTFISEIKNMAVTRKNTNKLDRVYSPDTNKTLLSRYCDPRMLSAFLPVGNVQ